MKFTLDQRLAAAKAMKKIGGSFSSAIGEAIIHADSGNVVKLEEAFGTLMLNYLGWEDQAAIARASNLPSSVDRAPKDGVQQTQERKNPEDPYPEGQWGPVVLETLMHIFYKTSPLNTTPAVDRAVRSLLQQGMISVSDGHSTGYHVTVKGSAHINNLLTAKHSQLDKHVPKDAEGIAPSPEKTADLLSEWAHRIYAAGHARPGETADQYGARARSEKMTKNYDRANPCDHVKGFPCGDCGRTLPEDFVPCSLDEAVELMGLGVHRNLRSDFDDYLNSLVIALWLAGQVPNPEGQG